MNAIICKSDFLEAKNQAGKPVFVRRADIVALAPVINVEHSMTVLMLRDGQGIPVLGDSCSLMEQLTTRVDN